MCDQNCSIKLPEGLALDAAVIECGAHAVQGQHSDLCDKGDFVETGLTEVCYS